MRDWVKMPSTWLRQGDPFPLSKMKWQGANKSDNTAALMVYIAMLHHTNDEHVRDLPDIGFCKITYTALSEITNLSRKKVSAGINMLCEMEVISKEKVGSSNIYEIENYPAPKKGGWAMLPARALYSYNYTQITAFKDFKLRSKVELNALKIYLIIAVFRDNNLNTTKIGYDKLSGYSGVRKNDIKSALSMLIASSLIKIDSFESYETDEISEHSNPNIYRLCHVEGNKHRGNQSVDKFADDYDQDLES